MKKILTLLVMLLCGWSIVSAQTQTPAFGYQMVVRTAENVLVVNTDVVLTISLTDGVHSYSETKNATTDDLGMLSVLVGGGDGFASIDWSNVDSITSSVKIGDEEVFVFKTAVQAVPYALQAGKSKITKDQIVNYLSDPETTIEDYKQVMQAVVGNVPTEGELWNMIKNRVVTYLKNRKDKAVDIAAAYLEQAQPEDVQLLYSQLTPEVKTKIMNLAKQSALDNKDFAMEVVEAYLPSMTAADVDDAVAVIEQRINDLTPEEQAELREKFIQHAVPFAKSHMDLVVTAANYFLAHVTGQQVSTFLSTVFNNPENPSEMKQAFVDVLFYNYLDYYFRPTIINALNEYDFSDYLEKQTCDGQEVDVCPMKSVIQQ